MDSNTPLGHKTTIRIPKDLHKAAKIRALELDVTFSEVVRACVELWLQGQIELPAREERDTETSP